LKLTNIELDNASKPLAEVMGQKFPVPISLKLATMMRVIDPPLKDFMKVKDELIKHHGTADKDNPSNIHIQPGDPGWSKFNEEYGELLKIANEVKIIKVTLPLTTVTACPRCKNKIEVPVEIEPTALVALEKFITFK